MAASSPTDHGDTGPRQSPAFHPASAAIAAGHTRRRPGRGHGRFHRSGRDQHAQGLRPDDGGADRALHPPHQQRRPARFARNLVHATAASRFEGNGPGPGGLCRRRWRHAAADRFRCLCRTQPSQSLCPGGAQRGRYPAVDRTGYRHVVRRHRPPAECVAGRHPGGDDRHPSASAHGGRLRRGRGCAGPGAGRRDPGRYRHGTGGAGPRRLAGPHRSGAR